MICYAHGSPLVSIGRRRGRSFVWNRPRAGIDVRHRTANCFAKQASSAWCSATGRRKGRELFRTDGSIIWKRGCAERLWSLMAARELLFHCERMGGKRPPRVIAFWFCSAPRKAQSLSKSSPGNFDTVRHLIYSFGQEYSYTRLWLGVGE